MLKNKKSKKNDREVYKTVLSGSLGGVARAMMMELKDHPEEKEYTETVNELIGSDKDIDGYEIFMAFGKDYEKEKFTAANALVNYILQDDNRSSITKRAIEVMHTKNGKVLLAMAYTSLGLEMYAYADKVFDYSYNIMYTKSKTSMSRFMIENIIGYGMLGLLSYVIRGNLSLVTPILSSVLAIPLVYNSWVYHKTVKRENYQTPQQLLDQTDRFEKFELMSRLIHDIQQTMNTDTTKNPNFIHNLSEISNRLQLLVKSVLTAIKACGV